MTPKCQLSIRRVNESTWILGSMMICEQNCTVAANSISTWEDKAGATFSIRPMLKSEQELYSGMLGEQEAEENRIHSIGSSAACWRFGDAYFKVKSWCEGMDTESNLIAFARKAVPSLPVPEVYCSWLDKAWNRSFLVLAAVEGKTLDEAWPSLTDIQRQKVAATVATFCENLASQTSQKLQNPSGGSVLEPFLTYRKDFALPSWIPHPLPPLSQAELHAYLTKLNPETQLKIGDTFYFYHADLGPTNILLSEEKEISGIIDWESAGFYPRFWIGTKPLVSGGFHLCAEQELAKKKAWAVLLASELQERGFGSDLNMYKEWKKSIGFC